jgi:hypothetical protein
MAQRYPPHDGTFDHPTPGVGGQACGILVDAEYGREVAEYVVAEATRRTMGRSDRYVRWERMFRVLEDLGITMIRAETLDALRQSAPPSGPPRGFADVVDRYPETRPEWMKQAVLRGIRTWVTR